MEPRPCPSCERGTLTERGGKGRFFPHRVFASLELPEDVLLPTCDFCHKTIVGPRQAAAFDEGMARAYAAKLSEMISGSVQEITEHISQQDLERLLGFSRGYVSKLKLGKESSAPTAALLGLLAADPAARLRQLEALWSGQPAPTTTAPVSVDVRASIHVEPASSSAIPSGRKSIPLRVA